jgi:lipopolysaccharide transport system ATP-binding protein
MKPILEIRNASKKYRIHHMAGGYLSLRERLLNGFSFRKNMAEDFWALQDVSFDVQPGESIGIIGRNGAGKSTLLKILSRITPPSTGKIITRGRIASLLEVGTGFHPELTGRENIFFNGSLLGMNQSEILRKFDEIVEFSGTERFLDTQLKHFSSGMQLRLAFSVAAFLEPEILIIDEVLAVGDADFQNKCIGKMESVIDSGRTILFVSHNMSAVSELCSKTVLLDAGKVVMIGKPAEVINTYTQFEKNQIGTKSGQKELPNGVFLKYLNVQVDSNSSLSYQSLSFSFGLRSVTRNPITGLALLLYNEHNERVGIVDLRDSSLSINSSNSLEITVEGIVSKLPLVEGVYYVGLNIVSNLYQGDVYKLAKFEVYPVKRKIVAFDKKYRGIVEFDYQFQVQ